MNIKTRMPPSPTGLAHVGNAYAALFNYAFARKHDGEFVLRIEDTDQKRNVEGGEEAILDLLKWVGLEWDGDIVRQSERKEIYKKHAEKLIAEGKAYKEDGGIILKVEPQVVSWTDGIRGKVEFPADQLKDYAILKKDGFPAYNFAVVVDDYEMGITHVIRGEDHISNTPRQIVAYKALGWELPKFAHFPLLRNPDKSKMSKRNNNVSMAWYRSEGYLPEAFANYLMLLGWSHPAGKEVFSLEEFVKEFSLERVKTSAPAFDVRKLEWINSEYIKNLSTEDLSTRIHTFFDEKYDLETIAKTAPLVAERINTLKEYESIASFYYEKPEIDQSLFGEDYKAHIETAHELLDSVSDWKLENINKNLETVVQDESVHTGKFFMDLRIAITGKKVTPPINESLVILGKDETLARLRRITEAA